MAVREGQRQAYLRELGVQSYFPRRALPGAKPSPRYFTESLRENVRRDVNENVNASVRDNLTASVPRTVTVEANVQRLAALIGTPTAPASAVKTPVTQAALSETPPASLPEPVAITQASEQIALEDTRFAFAYFPITEELAVINELPWAKSAAVSPACRQLLAAILKALSVPCDEKDLTSMVFTWPLAEGPDIDRSAQSARHTLDGFLARRFKLRPVRYLLVLAEQSAEYLFPAQFEWQKEGMKRHPHHAVDVIVTRSLNAMEAVPDIKRSVWQALQPLRAALANPHANVTSPVSNGQ